MDVILLRDVEKVGLRGEVVNVAAGYARNFLLPRKLAERATPGRVAELERIEARRARQEARSFEQGKDVADVLAKTVLRFEVKAGPTGSLFGSVTSTDLADEIWRVRRIRIDRRKIDLHEPIKRIGRYMIPIEVFQDVDVEVKTLVVPEGGELPPEEELEAMAAAEAAEPEGATEASAAAAAAADDALAATAAQDAQPDAAAEEISPEAPAGDAGDGFYRTAEAAVDAGDLGRDREE
jgi:large subunit ribosomal protein L9